MEVCKFHPTMQTWVKFPIIPPGGIKYHPVVSEPDILSTYTGLDDYDTLFEA